MEQIIVFALSVFTAFGFYALLAWVGVEEPVPVVDAPPAQTAAERAGPSCSWTSLSTSRR